jgi:hypothetical protein
MKLLIKFPTRNRPFKFLSVLEKYIDLMDDKNNEIIVSCDNNDLSMNQEFVTKSLSKYKNVKIFYSDNKSKIEAINANLTNIHFDIILLASDDMIPIIKGYDTIIKNKMKINFPDTDGVLWFNDGYQKNNLNTLCILGKKYYDRFNYIYYPGYKSVWCDNEFMEVSKILNKQIYFDEVIIQHQHPDWGFGGRDEIHTKNINNENSDKNLFLERKLNNFYL